MYHYERTAPKKAGSKSSKSRVFILGILIKKAWCNTGNSLIWGPGVLYFFLSPKIYNKNTSFCSYIFISSLHVWIISRCGKQPKGFSRTFFFLLLFLWRRSGTLRERVQRVRCRECGFVARRKQIPNSTATAIPVAAVPPTPFCLSVSFPSVPSLTAPISRTAGLCTARSRTRGPLQHLHGPSRGSFRLGTQQALLAAGFWVPVADVGAAGTGGIRSTWVGVQWDGGARDAALGRWWGGDPWGVGLDMHSAARRGSCV